MRDEMTPSGAAELVARSTLAAAGIEAAEVDCVISCTNTPDFNNPGLVSCLLHRLGRTGIPGLELKNLAIGPLQGVDLACRLVGLGRAGCVLVTGVDLLARFFTPVPGAGEPAAESRAAQSMCGDGALALLVSAKHRGGAAWRWGGMSVELIADSLELFWCPLPAANHFPLRLSAADLLAGRHLPRLRTEALRHLLAAHLPSFLEVFEAGAGEGAELVTHAPVSLTGILPGRPAVDVREDLGFIGAAGVLAGLARVPTAPRVTLLAVSAGVQVACARMERVG